MSKPILTIIITIFNCKHEYLVRSLGHILSSNNPNCEIIIIDDGSLLEYSSMIDNEVTKSKSQYKIFKTKNNGLSHARNIGILEASGKYLAFLDCDDFLDKNAMISLLSESDYDVDIIEFGVKMLGDNIKEIIPLNDGFYSSKTYFSNLLNIGRYRAPATQRIYRTAFLLSNKLFFVESLLHEDEEWSLRVLYNSNSVYVTKKIFYIIYPVENSITKNTDSLFMKKRGNDLLLIYHLCLNEFSEINDIIHKLIRDYLVNLLIHHRNIIKFDYNVKISLVKNSYKIKTRLKTIIFILSGLLYNKLQMIEHKLKEKVNE